MCGIVGLFIGCPLEEVCVKKQIASSFLKKIPSEKKFTYKSNLDNWDTSSSVRSQPRRIIDEEELVSKSYFSPNFVPITKHAEICSLEKEIQSEVLTQHLYRYLDFTSKLEHIVVNNVAMAIAQDSLSIQLPEDMVFDAYKIYCDEAYHAYFSIDLVRQVKSQTNIVPKLLRWPNFILKLRQIQHQMPTIQSQKLVEIFFVIVSETLISGTLAKIPTEPSILTAVRDVIRDHSRDEGKHHQYFASLLYILWPRLTIIQKRIIGPILPDLIFSFLTPDTNSIKYELQTYKLKAKKIDEIIMETYPQGLVVESTKKAASVTLMHFAKVGVFDDPATKEAFLKSGLI